MNETLQDFIKIVSKLPNPETFAKLGKTLMEIIAKTELALSKRIDDKLAQIKDGETPSKEELVSLIQPLIPKPVKGDKGETGRAIFGGKGEDGYTPVKGKDYFDGKDGSEIAPEEIANKLETLIGDDRLSKDAVRGIDEIEKKIQQIEIRPAGRGGGKGIGLYIGGSKKLLTAQTLNLVAGANVTLTYAYASGRNDVTISAGAGAFSLLAATGTVDDSNKAFTFISKPSIVVVNGASYRENNGWSWNAGTLTATLDFAPGVSGDVYAIG